MDDQLYDVDTLLWSERQADLLRRLAGGEKVNEAIDWPHVIEEIHDVGLSQLCAVRSLMAHALEHLLKIAIEPDAPSVRHWRHEVRVFLADARRSWTPSMRQRVELDDLYIEARELVGSDIALPPLPETCPFVITDLMVDRPGIVDVDALLARLGQPARAGSTPK